MPYITQERRVELDPSILGLVDHIGNRPIQEQAGEINYVISRLLNFWPRRYWALALACGMLVTCLLEFYRRVAVPYEEEKIKANGDVY